MFGSIGYCMFVVVILSFSNVYARKDYCSMNYKYCPQNVTHISCTNNGTWGFDDSFESAKLIRMTHARIRLLEDLHNSRRQKLAMGHLQGFEPASRMGVMKWNGELAHMACYNVFRCNYGHDDCRNTERFRSAGQNLYLHYCNFPYNDTESILRDACKSWWDEYHLCDMELINSFQPNPDVARGHFTQMARDKSNCFGCGMGHWLSKGFHQYYLVCNYGMTSSMDRKIYTTGMPGTDCKTGCDAKYPALCSAAERYMSELEEMQMEYDLAHGIEPSATETSSLYASSRSQRLRSSRRSNSTRTKSTTIMNRRTCTRDVDSSASAKALSSINTFSMAGSSAKPKTKHHHSYRHSHSHACAYAEAH